MSKLKLYFESDGYCSLFFKNNVEHIETSKEDCDFVISDSFEFGIYDKAIIQKKLNGYLDYTKKVIVFLVSDYNTLLNVPDNVILFRTSLYKSLKKDNEEVLPYFWEGFDEDFKILKKSKKPVVGFCGDIRANSGNRLKSISKLEKSNDIQTNFIKRNFFGAARVELRKEFMNNILNSHFTLSNRGRGNFSIRFYQVLSLGRIPILINTNMLFPFEDKIDWSYLIVYANSDKKLIKKVNEFWKNNTEDELNQKSENCKKTYNNYFTPKAFGNLMNELLINEIKSPRIIKKKRGLFLKFPHQKFIISRYSYMIKEKIKNKFLNR